MAAEHTARAGWPQVEFSASSWRLGAACAISPARERLNAKVLFFKQFIR